VQTQASSNSIPIPPILPPALGGWADSLAPALRRLFFPDELIQMLEEARCAGPGTRFAARLLELLEIDFTVTSADLHRIPARGPTMVVANHPYGIVDGLILMIVLDRVRPDCKILANSWLRWIEALADQMILVNPFETRAANIENRAALRRALRWLSYGGLLATFPSGEVAHLDWKAHSVTDPVWKATAARLALRVRCATVPVFFEGANSVPFQVAGILHPGLRTAALAREFARMRGRSVQLRIGTAIPSATLSGYRDAYQATSYLRHRTFFLTNRSESPGVTAATPARMRTLGPAGTEKEFSDEIAALPQQCELTRDRNFSVYLVNAPQIPLMLREIGRCRELAFRNVGEGTGNHLDLDRFDDYYQHLFLWNRSDRRLAGAYRLVVTSDLLPRFGIAGLYTSTLFRFHPDFFRRIGPALELGRSFVLPEYQKNYAALLLLWKGITRAVQRRPEAPILFGAVSISQGYSPVSRSLIAAYLSDRAGHELARMVTPRRRFRHRAMRNEQLRRLVTMAPDIEDISFSISDIEADGKGMPVLIRQYLKAGGRVLGFSVDPDFSNTLDALILADLRTAPAALLDRCLGKEEAQVLRTAPTAASR